MLNKVSSVVATVPGALHAALQAIQEPGVLDRIGAGGIAVFVVACWLFAPSSRRAR